MICSLAFELPSCWPTSIVGLGSPPTSPICAAADVTTIQMQCSPQSLRMRPISASNAWRTLPRAVSYTHLDVYKRQGIPCIVSDARGIVMGRRNLLTEEERDQFFLVSVNEANLIKHYTLSPDDLEKALAKRGARNQLGFALQLCLLRYPGFGLRIDEPVPQDLLDYLAHQLSVRSEVFRDYSRRHQTRLDHAGELAEFLGLRAFTPGDFRAAVSYTHLDVYKRQLLSFAGKQSRRANASGHCRTLIIASARDAARIAVSRDQGRRNFKNWPSHNPKSPLATPIERRI